uniref:Cytoplasmic tRNA 2-thiolation protein 2 n=1 Tax=Parascaris equorum TaxID=6256 RepID=A0A914S5K3_PAREQ
MRHGDGPKPKKKRTQQKKLPVGTSNEVQIVVFIKLIQLLKPVIADKPSIVGSRVGDMCLVFMRDYYTSMFECPVDEETLYPSMSTFIGEKKELKGELMVNLIVEGGEGEFNPALTFDRLMTLLNVSSRPEYQLDTPPQTPEIAHREFTAFMNYDFSKILPASSFCTLNLFTSSAREKVLNKDLLLSESLEGIKTEEFTREELQSCRHCGVLVEEPVIRQPAKQLAIIPQNEKDEEILFCSMVCYYNFVANTKVALSPDDLTVCR